MELSGYFFCKSCFKTYRRSMHFPYMLEQNPMLEHPSVEQTMLEHPSVEQTQWWNTHPSNIYNTLIKHPNERDTMIQHQVVERAY